jgi:glucose/arabinose dehydrogenase
LHPGIVGTRGHRGIWAMLVGAACVSCGSGREAASRSSTDGQPPPDLVSPPSGGSFCSLPGSLVFTPQGQVVVPGARSTPDLTWLHLPAGFCAHYFATVNTARQLRFAPGGDLFVASPTAPTTGGGGNGIAGIVVLPDDNHDGLADANITFLSGIPATQGLMFANGSLYYQDDTSILRVPYKAGDRAPSAPSSAATLMGIWAQATEHWPKVFDIAQDGTIFVSNGGSQSDQCVATNPVRGAIVKLNADGSTSKVSTGFRNPIAMRCESNHNVCLVAELALDYSGSSAGREKIVPVRPGDNWGYPCCATKNVPYAGFSYRDTGGVPDCAGVSPESVSFIIGHTPFGLDFETGQWPEPWKNRVFVTLHGDFGTWAGARLVAVALDPATGLPLPATEIPDIAASPDNMLEFATGWDDGRQDHGRPAPLAFAADGRLFLGNDQQGTIVWIAPVDLARP